MSGKLPIDRVREAQDAPRIRDEHREQFATRLASIRDAAGPVDGARPTQGSSVDAADTPPDASGPGGQADGA